MFNKTNINNKISKSNSKKLPPPLLYKIAGFVAQGITAVAKT